MATLKIELSQEETSFVATFEESMSAESYALYTELLEAVKTDGKKFTRLAYKAGESAIRAMLARKDFTLWEDYVSALKALGTAGEAVLAYARQLAKFVMGGREAKPDGQGYYFVPAESFFSSYRVDGETVYTFDFDDKDEDACINDALDFARENKGKLFCIELKRKPAKKGPLDAFADRARDIRFTLASTAKKDRAAIKKIKDQVADSGIDMKEFEKVLALLARVKNVG